LTRIVSFSSIPTRFDKLDVTIASLLSQTEPADKILLYIPETYRRFPDWDGTLPKVPDGIEIRRTAHDLGPATKILAAASEFRGQDIDILFCDDDRDYPKDMFARFWADRLQHPNAVICGLGLQASIVADSGNVRPHYPRSYRTWRITDVGFQLHYLWNQIKAGTNWRNAKEPNRRAYKRSGYVDIFEGCGGVLVKPDFFDQVAYDIPPVLWSVDDVWLSGMLARRDIPIWLHGNLAAPVVTGAGRVDALVHAVIEGADRSTANRLAVEYMQATYGIWP